MLEWFNADMASPLLPGTTGLWWARRLSWALVLGAVLLLVWPSGLSGSSGVWASRGGLNARAQHRRYLLQLMALALLCVLCLLPGVWSPAYWLGLAFQMPSLMSVALALHVLHARLDGPVRTRWAMRQRTSALNSPEVLVLMGVVLGWVLLLDVLAFWPLQIYTLGFDVRVFMALAALALMAWVRWGERLHESWRWLLCVLVVFALSRWPSGNLWSALLDPVLWVGAHGWLLWRAIKARA